MGTDNQKRFRKLLRDVAARQLTSLDISRPRGSKNSPLDHIDCCELIWAIESGQLRSIRNLSLARQPLSGRVLRDLVSALERLPRICSLDLAETGMEESGARYFAQRAGLFSGLEVLRIGGNSVGPRGVRALVSAVEEWPLLRELSLQFMGLRAPDIGCLVRAGANVQSLSVLDLGGNRIGNKGVDALADGAMQWPLISVLDLSACGIDDVGLEALARAAPAWPLLKTLRLGCNRFASEAGKLLATAAHNWPILQELDLFWNPVGDDGVRALVAAEGVFGELRSLILDNVKMGDEGAGALARSADRLRALERLTLGSNHITDNGLRDLGLALGHQPWRTSLREFGFSNNWTKTLPIELEKTTEPAVWVSFFEQRSNEESVPLCRTKVLLLGEGRVGKTHLRRRLFERRAYYHSTVEPETQGVDRVTCIVRSTIGNAATELTVSVYDFAGQHALHGSHRLFLSDKRSIAVIVCDATKTRQENRLDYWLGFARHELSTATPVVVVVTKCDLRDDDGERVLPRALPILDAEELKRSACLAPDSLLRVVDGVGWYGPEKPDCDPSCMRLEHERAMQQLEHTVADYLRLVPDIESRYPSSLVSFVDWIASAAFRGLDGEVLGAVRRSSLEEAATQFKLSPLLMSSALDIAHNVGLVVCAGSRGGLRRGEALAEVVFNPEWLRVPVYTVLQGVVTSTKRGILSWNQVERLLPERTANPVGATVWERCPFGSHDRIMLLELMKSFGLLFEVRHSNESHRYFVPDHLTPRARPLSSGWRFAWRREFDWLPESLFGRLLGRLVGDMAPEPESLWRNEITLAVGAARTVVRLENIEAPNTVKSHIVIATDVENEQEGIAILNSIEAEFRSILGESLVNAGRWVRICSTPAATGTLLLVGRTEERVERDGLSHDAESLLKALRDVRDQAQRIRVPEHAWRTKSDWFSQAGIDRHRPDCMALIAELIAAELVESRDRGKWRQYRARVASPSSPAR